MSSLLTTDDLIEWASNLPGTEWRRLTTSIAWLHRRYNATEEDVPAQLRSLHETVLDPDAWDAVRRRVAKQRRALYRLRIKEKQEAAVQRRRQYMREYMARYRTKRK